MICRHALTPSSQKPSVNLRCGFGYPDDRVVALREVPIPRGAEVTMVKQCQICENPTCGIQIHNPCVARYFKGRSEPRCPACDDFWPHEIPEVRWLQSQPRR
ncbi:non-structural maintenance of chromosomes element 1 homolog isoform X2 [Centroberyx affinis]|uniref:non-structural maintenance of chromosomes element 1 homolog isoform X2 n=1 Tax=Centroberyx affinis TaxID=166261 RepID=UPI003A5BA8E0